MKAKIVRSLIAKPLRGLVLFPAALATGLALLGGLRSNADTAPVDYTDKLEKSVIFNQRLVWVGSDSPTEAESEQLWNTFIYAKHLDASLNGLEAFIHTHTNSPWRPSLELNMANRYRQTGYFSLALDHWESAWRATQTATDIKARQVADSSLANLLELLSSLGRTDRMKTFLDEAGDRHFSQASQGLVNEARSSYEYMLGHPGSSYRCGTYALDAVAGVLKSSNYDRQIGALPSPSTGFSLAKLEEIANSNHLDMIAVERPPGAELIVPSVVHWKEDHYAAILEKRGEIYRVVDPTFSMVTWLTRQAIDAESSGQFLVPAKQAPATWRRLAVADSSLIFGKGHAKRTKPNPSPPCETNCPPCAAGTGGVGGNGNSGSGNGNGGCCGGGGGIGKGAGIGDSGGTDPSGMPHWTVMGPNLSHWVIDEPLAYQPALGPRISFKIYNDSSEASPPYTPPPQPHMGQNLGWGNSWWSSLIFPTGNYLYGGGGTLGVTLYAAGGGIRDDYVANDPYHTPEYFTKTYMTYSADTNNNLQAFTLYYPSGASDVYALFPTNILGDYLGTAYLTQTIDPQGHATTIRYNTNASWFDPTDPLLTVVIDGDGKTNLVAYTNLTWLTTNSGVVSTNVFSNLLSTITSPYSNSCTLTYGIDLTQAFPNVVLSNVTDVVGMTSGFGYNYLATSPFAYNDVLTNLTTPYGTTTFGEQAISDGATVLVHSLVVNEPENAHQMYLYIEAPSTNFGSLYGTPPKTYTDTGNVITNRPTEYDQSGSPFDTLDNADWNTPTNNDGMQNANTYYWGRMQFANLSAGFLATGATNWDLTQLTTNDYVKAQLSHWLFTDEDNIGLTLSMQQEPSPDGTTPGKMTWYDYVGKIGYVNGNYFFQGNSGFPSLIIKVLPDGNNRYEMRQVDSFGNITNVITTFTSNSTVTTRSNRFVFSTNGVDLLRVIGPDGVTNVSYGYNNNHEVSSMTNAVGEVTTYAYDGNGLLTSTASPSGLVTTNIYDGNLRLVTAYSYSVVAGVTNYFDTNTYTWMNDLVLSHTDSRGLTTTNTWDALERLLKVTYPDGTYITNTYGRLDIIQTVDRMGFTNLYGYDGLDRLAAQTNAIGTITRYGYCSCGALTSLTNAYATSVQAVTLFSYDNQGNRTVTTYPDSYTITDHYNSVRQLTNMIDSAGVSVTNWFNNQGLVYAASNYFGQVFKHTLDIDDRIATNVDANGVSTVMTYDTMGRILARTYPDNGVEHFVYTNGTLIAYTNQLTNLTHYGYDAALRKTFETNANNEVTKFSYNGAGDLLTLTDGKIQVTTWHYDVYGLVSNKVDNDGNIILTYLYDADQRLTNRNSIAKGNTYYYYDKVGNITNVTYHVSPSISMGYDALNRLTSIIDGVGTTQYGYDAAGHVLSEVGPWNDDTMTLAYSNRLRFSLSLQAPNASPWVQTYAYDGARRLTNTTSSAGSFGYAYDGICQTHVKKLTLPSGAYISHAYDSDARMITNELFNSGSTVLDANNYDYNVGNQRTSQDFVNGNYENYTYDNIGQLVGAMGSESGGANRLQEQLRYAYDAAHNLNIRTNNGLVQTFNVNDLNELSNTIHTGTLTVAGTVGEGSLSANPVSVTVSGTGSASVYSDWTWVRTNVTVTNGNNTYTATATDNLGRACTNSVTVYLPTTNNFKYDLNGNLTNDGWRTFTYDDENELTSVVASNGIAASTLTSNIYDGKMRRRIRKDYVWSGSWVQTAVLHYVYDGNVVIQERDGNNLPSVTYTRGKDLSGSLQGAGGIGGLLARTDNHSSIINSPQSTTYYNTDGNGNITALISSGQYILARYKYDAFGSITSQSGAFADANTYRFSSKEWDENAGLAYYLYRFYDPNLQRWVNRDPIQEVGNETARLNYNNRQPNIIPNLFFAVLNDPIDKIDMLGLMTFTSPCSAEHLKLAQRLCAFLGQGVLECAEYDSYYTDGEMQVHEEGWVYRCGKPPPPPPPPPPPYKPDPITQCTRNAPPKLIITVSPVYPPGYFNWP